ncbi:protein of unknown function [Friedmanniella luteola]|uniref:DUF4192 domain-containing protein n=1 Tax=Friedmanniella luteola TaxID=546871 RepID=A0A1H1XCZ7_9ACTN|nr:DUF4192 domain-containing protein [Friedmanniella luteola]SDT06566.1 protein of unknown function [Friedmanniella luteola]
MTVHRPQPLPDRPAASRGRPPDPHRLRVRRPADFLAVIPYLLGFHPEESLVVVLCRRGRVLLTARLDLPRPADAPGVAAQVRQLTTQHGVDALVLVGYGDDQGATRATLEQVRTGVVGAVPVREVVLVSRARWWSLSCTSGCCPAGGAVFDPDAHPLAAEAVYRGLVAGRSRAALVELVGGPGPDALPRLRGLVGLARSRWAGVDRPTAAAALAAAVEAAVAGGGAVDEEVAVRLAVLGLDLAVRDVGWALMSRSAAEGHQRLWAQVVAVAPPEVASAPVALLGAAAWIGGNGALLNCCVERLERDDPGCTLGHLLAELSERALPPSLWDEMVGGLRAEVGAVAGVPGLH